MESKAQITLKREDKNTMYATFDGKTGELLDLLLNATLRLAKENDIPDELFRVTLFSIIETYEKMPK